MDFRTVASSNRFELSYSRTHLSRTFLYPFEHDRPQGFGSLTRRPTVRE